MPSSPWSEALIFNSMTDIRGHPSDSQCPDRSAQRTISSNSDRQLVELAFGERERGLPNRAALDGRAGSIQLHAALQGEFAGCFLEIDDEAG